MATDVSLQAALDRIFRRARHGIRPGLERIAALCARLGDPQHAFAVVHVAGTNGKGSVCAMIESVLRAAGLRTGLYTSPHLLRFHERIRVDGRPIGDGELAALIGEIEPLADAVGAERGETVTFFEIATALAFAHFRRAAVQVGVIETGMGGRWDATNVVEPAVSAIVEVGMDHAEYLGPTIEAIAGEKAGIVKPGRPAVCGATDAGARAVIAAAARAAGAPLIRAEEAVTVARRGRAGFAEPVSIETAGGRRLGRVLLPLPGDHQLRNLAVAVATIEAFEAAAGVTLPDAALREGLAAVEWPGRLQRLASNPTVLLDAAHNPAGAAALAQALRRIAGPRRVFLVAGLLADKDAAGFAAPLAPVTRACWTVPVAGSERSRDAASLAAEFAAAGLPAKATDLVTALAEARAAATEAGGVVCVAGSLFLAAEAIERYGEGRLFEAGGRNA